MSSKSRRRRQRKSKQKNETADNGIVNSKYGNKFRIIEEDKMTEVLMHGYIRQNKPNADNLIPLEIEQLCVTYFNDQSLTLNEPDEIIIPSIIKFKYEQEPWSTSRQYAAFRQRKSNGTLKITDCKLKFNSIFHALSSYEKRLVCRRIIKQRKLPIHDLTVWPLNNPSANAMLEQLYFVEYVLCKRYNTVAKLDLAELDLNDDHILYLCNVIENIVKYITGKKQQQKRRKLEAKSSKHSKEKPKKGRKDGHWNSTQNEANKTIPKYSRNRKVQREIERQLRMKESQKENAVIKVEIKMKLDEVNLSWNDSITDKHLPLLLRTMKKYLRNIKVLNLSSTGITNKSLSEIMKYNIKGLRIDLSNCEGITMKGLNRYSRVDYDDETPEKFVYCENMVYFVNEYEEQCAWNENLKGGKRVRGKGRKFRANRKKVMYTGQDAQETGYLSMEDWWAYA